MEGEIKEGGVLNITMRGPKDTPFDMDFPMVKRYREIIPGNKRIVHHVIAHVLPPETTSGVAKRLGGEFPQADADPASIFYKEGSLSRVKMDAPVIDDGAHAANGGSLFRRIVIERPAHDVSQEAR